MSDPAPPQSRTPRASRHKHSTSAVPSAENIGTSSPHTQHLTQSRIHNARKAVDPAWHNGTSTPTEGYFNNNGEFVMPADFLPARGYSSPQAQQSGPKRTGKKQVRNKNNPPRPNGNHSPHPPRHQYEQQQQMSAHLNQPFPPYATTPAKTSAAYAGPTWNASPAPSALPMPKFFSKSMPQETSQVSLQNRLDQESDQSDKAESPALIEADPAIPSLPLNDDSPLDFLFKKDKEQKAKRQSTGSGKLDFTPSRPAIGSFNTEPRLPTDWTSIYGTGASNHNRHGSNGSNKEQFMMELDGSNVSSQSHKVSPRPTFNDRMSSAPSAASPYQNMAHNGQQHAYDLPMHGNSMPSLMPSPGQPYLGSVVPDASASPFYRGPQQAPRSADTSPMPRPPTQYQQNLHYGNRNLGPLFQAAKQDLDRRASNLRQELHASPKVAELPDNANHFSRRGDDGRNYKRTMKPDQAVRECLPAQNPTSLTKIELSRQEISNSLPPPESSDLDAHPWPQSYNGPDPAPPAPNAHRFLPTVKFNAKSVEDDLKRMLKLSLSSNSFDSPGVH